VLRDVAILFHPRRRNAVAEAEWLALALKERGVRASVASAWDGGTVEQLCQERDLAITFGGDGTILRVARLSAPLQIPLVGINLGRVGFLAEMTPETLHQCVDELAEQRYWIERRTMLEVHCVSSGRPLEYLSLNEVVVARGVAPRAIQVHTTLDGQDFINYTADGVLVATATGSTAYSLAAGGPIMYPEAKDFLLTPIAPHLHIGRSMIVPSDSTLELAVTAGRGAVMSIDGHEERHLDERDRVRVRRSGLEALFARLGDHQYFYQAIAARLR